MSAHATEPHYSFEQCGSLMGGVSKRTVQRLVKPGGIWPVVKLSRKVVLIPASSLNEFLQAKRWEPKPLEVGK